MDWRPRRRLTSQRRKLSTSTHRSNSQLCETLNPAAGYLKWKAKYRLENEQKNLDLHISWHFPQEKPLNKKRQRIVSKAVHFEVYKICCSARHTWKLNTNFQNPSTSSISHVNVTLRHDKARKPKVQTKVSRSPQIMFFENNFGKNRKHYFSL